MVDDIISFFDSAIRLIEQLGVWTYQNLTLQVIVATLALIVAIRANRRSAKISADDRKRAGNISRVTIQQHSMQTATDHLPGMIRSLPSTSQRDAREPEGFICSVYSGETEVEVESVYLKIVFTKGILGQTRWEIHVDIPSNEGLALPATPLPHRMKRDSRLDWTFPTFVTSMPSKRGLERKVGVLRVMRPNEQLLFEFGAYARVSATPTIARSDHRLGLLGFPARGGPWTRVIKYPSLWEALTDPGCPASLRGWFLEWLECRVDFQEQLDADESGNLREWFHQVVLWNYWPPGQFVLYPIDVQIGDPDNDASRHRRARTLLAIPDMTLIDRGRTVSGPGGSSELGQFRLSRAMAVLSGAIPPVSRASEAKSWPAGLAINDPVLKAAAEARKLGDISGRRQLSRQERQTLSKHLSTMSLELSRCIYAPLSECEAAISEVFDQKEPTPTQ